MVGHIVVADFVAELRKMVANFLNTASVYVTSLMESATIAVNNNLLC